MGLARPEARASAPRPSRGAPDLVLFPTPLELDRFRDQGGLPQGYALPAICGFGPVAAGARTAQLLARIRPSRVILIGIAGAYDTAAHPVGSALTFQRVAVDGVGVGEGPSFHGPPALGFPQWPGSSDDGSPEIHDVLALDDGAVRPADASGPGELLLTTCAASDSPEHADRLASAKRKAKDDDCCMHACCYTVPVHDRML